MMTFLTIVMAIIAANVISTVAVMFAIQSRTVLNWMTRFYGKLAKRCLEEFEEVFEDEGLI